MYCDTLILTSLRQSFNLSLSAECKTHEIQNNMHWACLNWQADYSDHVQRDLLDALLRAKRSAENNNTAEISAESVGLSDDHLLMTVGDIFGAGVETTTTVLKWAVTYLIHYPQVRVELQQCAPEVGNVALDIRFLFKWPWKVVFFSGNRGNHSSVWLVVVPQGCNWCYSESPKNNGKSNLFPVQALGYI